MINLGDAVLFFKGDMNDLLNAMDESKRAAQESLGGIADLAHAAGAAMTVMGAGIVASLAGTITEFANTGDNVNDLSKKIGFSTEEVSKWGFALGQSGGNVQMLQTGVRGMANAIEAAKTATDETGGAFGRLGISITELATLTPEQQFMKLALAVAAIPDPLERAALAQDVFGKAGMDLLPVLADGEAGLRAMFDQAERAGAVFSQEQANLADAYNDALGELSAAAGGAGKEIAIALIPSLIEAAGWVRDTVIAFKDWANANPQTLETIVKLTAGLGAFMTVAGPILMILPGIATAIAWLTPLFAALGGAIAAVVGVISAPIALIIAGVVAIGLAAWGVWENWEAVKQALADTWAGILGAFESFIGTIGEYAGWIGQNIVQAFTDPVTFIMEYWQGLGDFFNGIFEWIGSGVDFLMTNVIDPIWARLTEFYDWLTGIFFGAFETGWNMGNAITGGTEPAPGFAGGTLSAPGGLAWVGEQGPELMYVPRGAQVYPADQSAAMAAGGGATVNIHIGAVSLPNRAAIQEFNRGLGDEVSRRLSARGLSTRFT